MAAGDGERRADPDLGDPTAFDDGDGDGDSLVDELLVDGGGPPAASSTIPVLLMFLLERCRPLSLIVSYLTLSSSEVSSDSEETSEEEEENTSTGDTADRASGSE